MNQHRGAERGSSGNNQVSPVPRCVICAGTYEVFKNKKFRGHPVCNSCNNKMRKFSRMSEDLVKVRGGQAVATLMCLVLARRGYKEGVDVANLLKHVLE